MQDVPYLEYVVILAYLGLLVGMGLVFRRFNSNVSDYFRNGCKGTWWMVGASAFMTAFSAWTFTGAAGAAYEAGWAVAVIFVCGSLGFFVHFLFLGAWFRQLRAITVPEVIRDRFGPVTQQFYAWIAVPLGIAYAAVWLYGLAIFSASVFGYPIHWVILVTGAVVLIYSVFGGSWGVMATDFLQTLILFPITLLVAGLCLIELGGVGGFVQATREAGLTQTFSPVHAADEYPLGKYAIGWIIGVVVYKLINQSTIATANRYFAVKDGWEARKAGLLAAVLMLFGTAFWFIPPMAARLLIPEVVAAADMPKPAEASYALISLKLLPTGMAGLMIVAMFAATMSSMDSGLNRNAAIFTQDIYPAFCRLLGVEPMHDKALLRLGQVFSLGFGLAIIGLAMYFAGAGGNEGVFELMLDVGAILALPMALPLLLALFIKRVPPWAALFAVGAAGVTSALSFFDVGGEWPYEWKVLVNTCVGVLAFSATVPFWGTASAAYRHRVDAFFERLHMPVDFANEVGEANDLSQLRIVGVFALVTSAFVAALMILPNASSDRLGILFVASFIGVVGAALLWVANRSNASMVETSLSEPLQATDTTETTTRTTTPPRLSSL